MSAIAETKKGACGCDMMLIKTAANAAALVGKRWVWLKGLELRICRSRSVKCLSEYCQMGGSLFAQHDRFWCGANTSSNDRGEGGYS